MTNLVETISQTIGSAFWIESGFLTYIDFFTFMVNLIIFIFATFFA